MLEGIQHSLEEEENCCLFEDIQFTTNQKLSSLSVLKKHKEFQGNLEDHIYKIIKLKLVISIIIVISVTVIFNISRNLDIELRFFLEGHEETRDIFRRRNFFFFDRRSIFCNVINSQSYFM